jgi:multifunctional methyltransferase subunit TRM112
MLRKINFSALKVAATNLSISNIDDVEEVTETLAADEEFLRKVHHLLFEVHVIDGFLVCPQSGRKFPIKDGIPNMLLHEDEV